MTVTHRFIAALALSATVAPNVSAQGQIDVTAQELNSFLSNPPIGVDVAPLLQDTPVFDGLLDGADTAWNPETGNADFFHDGKRIVDTRLQIPADLWREGGGISNFAGVEITGDGYVTLAKDLDFATNLARATGNKQAVIVPSPRPPDDVLDTLAEQVVEVYGQGYTARPLNFAAEIGGNRVDMYELSLNGRAVAISIGNVFYGIPIGNPFDIPVKLREQLRLLPEGCGVSQTCVVPVQGLYYYEDAPPDLTVTIRQKCDWKITKAKGNCVLSSIGVAQILNPNAPEPKFMGSAVIMDQQGQFALTAAHVSRHLFNSGDRAFAVSNQLHEAQRLYVPIEEESHVAAGKRNDIPVDLSVFRFETQFDHDPNSAEGVFAHPILNSGQADAIKPGLPLVGVGFGENSEIGGHDASVGSRRSGLSNVVSCAQAPFTEWKNFCESGYYFLAKVDPSQRAGGNSGDGEPVLNPNQACVFDSGSPAYAQMEDETLVIVGILHGVYRLDEKCGDLKLYVNLANWDLQGWILQQLIDSGDGKMTRHEAMARILTPADALPQRTPFAVVEGHSHWRD